MLSKIKILFVFFVLAGLSGTGYLLTHDHESGAEIIYQQASFAIDVTDDRKLVGAADNVFVGKVIAQTGTKTNRLSPQTQFSVEVLENIKGRLTGTVTVNQAGGYETIVGKEYLYLMEGDQLLVSGETYLFVTRSKESEWHTFAPAYGNLLIEDQMDRQDKVERFESAFAQEIPFTEPTK